VNNLEICPAPENHGYKFQRVDLENQPTIKADCDLVVATDRGTTLEQNGARVYTTEHVLAALIWNASGQCFNQSGCALKSLLWMEVRWPFVEAIEKVGYQDQECR
jgi:UDP-3-O-[3-hydroxymyristoyl] N-acetylglucosamine deacetylase / 3-hydroxyacyl-[acyl-carrier-protein] dehydratase